MEDQYQGEGGSYVMKDGKRVRVTDPTKPSETGGARDENGKPLFPAAAEAEPKATNATEPARGSKKPAAQAD